MSSLKLLKLQVLALVDTEHPFGPACGPVHRKNAQALCPHTLDSFLNLTAGFAKKSLSYALGFP